MPPRMRNINLLNQMKIDSDTHSGSYYNVPVVQRKGDPCIYLRVDDDWYAYDPYSTPLGSGAMGTVWKGYKVIIQNGRITFGERIAVKRVNERYENVRSVRDRARIEASMAFRHPNLIEMIGCCMMYPDKGPVWLLSNFVFGKEIDKYLQMIPDGENKMNFVCNAMCQVLDALDYIHSRGITHRDIKPSNIMVEDGANVRLMDLGIARVSGGDKETFAGSFIGTPQYAAPEQIGGQELSAATDIYALGVTFYELLTGYNPFDDENDDENGSAMLQRHLTMTLPKNEKIPKRLYEVLLKATAISQDKRYQSAMEFRVAIQESLKPRHSLLDSIIKWFSM